MKIENSPSMQQVSYPVAVIRGVVVGYGAADAGARMVEGDSEKFRTVEKRETIMPMQTKYVFSAAMDVEPEKEALFNEVYDKEHVPLLEKVPGVIAVARFVKQPVTMVIGGERKTIVVEQEPKYNAFYEVESPDVLTSEAWGKAVDQGRWPGQIRPYTKNRRHVLYARLIP
jgi:hypothetical protein